MKNEQFREVSLREFTWSCGLEELLPLEQVNLEEIWIKYRGMHKYSGRTATYQEFVKNYKFLLKIQEDEEARRNSPFITDYIKHLDIGE